MQAIVLVEPKSRVGRVVERTRTTPSRRASAEAPAVHVRSHGCHAHFRVRRVHFAPTCLAIDCDLSTDGISGTAAGQWPSGDGDMWLVVQRRAMGKATDR